MQFIVLTKSDIATKNLFLNSLISMLCCFYFCKSFINAYECNISKKITTILSEETNKTLK